MSIVRISLGIIFILFVMAPADSPAQGERGNADTLRTLAPKIYVECPACGEEYLRTEIGYVNFVRDRAVAEIHILVTRQTTGGGGNEYMIEFIGREKYAGMSDTITTAFPPAETEDKVRTELIRLIKMGLIRYAVKTPIGNYLSVNYSSPARPAEVVDKWNYWVFKFSLNSNFNGEKSRHSLSIYSNISAKRTTEANIIQFSLWTNYNENRYSYIDYKATSISRGMGGSVSLVRGLSDHWSLGGSSGISSSTYSNFDLLASLSPKIEYNFFPYKQSSRRELRLEYRLSLAYCDYTEETIYGEFSEWRWYQRGAITLEVVRPWGSVSTQLSGSNYLHDFDKNYFELWGLIELRLFSGFSLSLNGDISLVHDQLSLPKGSLSQEDVILSRREMETSYNYWTSIGISYSFGSIYNNIVNPRFGN